MLEVLPYNCLHPGIFDTLVDGLIASIQRIPECIAPEYSVEVYSVPDTLHRFLRYAVATSFELQLI